MNFCDHGDPWITVGMPVYNAGSYLRDAVLSVIRQSLASWELILIDDASRDGSVASLGNIQDPRIRFIVGTANLGLAARLNQAIGLARGNYFARMDQDDICHPERLEKQVSFLIQNPQVDLVGCACLTIDKNNQVTGRLCPPLGHSQICQTPWKGFPLAHPSWMGKTSWFRQNPYRVPAPFLCEDQELLLRLHRSSQFANLPDTYLAYRLRDRTNLGQLTKTRIAWWKVQTKFFIKKAEIKNLILGLLSLFGRTLFDFLEILGITGRQKLPCGIHQKFQKPQSLQW